jgi:hypothetical protein
MQFYYLFARVVVVAADNFFHRNALVAPADLEMLLVDFFFVLHTEQGMLDNYKDFPEQDFRFRNVMFSLFFQVHMRSCKKSNQTRLKNVKFKIQITCNWQRVKN